MKRESYNSDTLKAFLYLARKENHKEYKHILKSKFPHYDHVALLKDEHYCASCVMPATEQSENCSGIYLTLNGLALANEITTNNSNRFFNKAAFVVSIVSLIISLIAAVFSLVPVSTPDTAACNPQHNPACSCALSPNEAAS